MHRLIRESINKTAVFRTWEKFKNFNKELNANHHLRK